MTGAKLVGATLHLVGCDADSGRVAELATIPFLALENDQFGFRVDGWKGETLYFALRDEPQYYSRPRPEGREWPAPLWETFTLDWQGQSRPVTALPADLERYAGFDGRLYVFANENLNDVPKTGPYMQLWVGSYDDDITIAVKTERDPTWRSLCVLKHRECVMVPYGETRPN